MTSRRKITGIPIIGFIVILICAVGCQDLQNLPASPTSSESADPTSTRLSVSPPTPFTASETAPAFGDFDYFLLALSWSPDYCTTNGSDDPQQCAVGKKLGFVLHGLWPQNIHGYPSDCSNETLPAAVRAAFPGLYPNEALYTHEWAKHGTCSGVSASLYLAFTKRLRQSVQIPPAYQTPEKPFRSSIQQIKDDFSIANPGSAADVFEPNCSGSGRYLKELYVCFSKEGQPVSCSAEVDKAALKSCVNADFLVRNMR